jgi:proline iminopeptidase
VAPDDDIERLRERLGIERWLVLGVSWGSTLGLLYAETHPERVTELVLGAVTAGRRSEIDWMYHVGAPRFFPEAWAGFRAALPEADREGDLVEGYARLLNDPDPAVRQRAADAWCTWETTYIAMEPQPTLTGRFADPDYRRTFARVVTHYFRHGCWLEDGRLIRDAGVLAAIPGTMIHSRLDLGGPLDTAWQLKQVWPRAELIVLDEPGHASDQLEAELRRATDRYAMR